MDSKNLLKELPFYRVSNAEFPHLFQQNYESGRGSVFENPAFYDHLICLST